MEGPLLDKSLEFASRVVLFYEEFSKSKKDTTIAKQLLRSATSIGANIKEAIRGYSKADFTSKMSISLKEASETEFWIELLRDTEYITKSQAESMLHDCQELIKLLMSIIKTAQGSNTQ
jgi:four helix bundle protein